MQLVLDRKVWGTEVLLSLCITRIQPKIQGFSWICMGSFRPILLFKDGLVPVSSPRVQPVAFAVLPPTIGWVVAGNGAVSETPHRIARL